MQGAGSTDMTLAFELEALKRLQRPDEVFADARSWSEYVGVVSDKPTYVVTNFTRKNRIRQDFFSGPRGKRESLENVGRQFDTGRHVFVGTDADDREVAEDVGGSTSRWRMPPRRRAGSWATRRASASGSARRRARTGRRNRSRVSRSGTGFESRRPGRTIPTSGTAGRTP
jgi:hypothetical protein